MAEKRELPRLPMNSLSLPDFPEKIGEFEFMTNAMLVAMVVLNLFIIQEDGTETPTLMQMYFPRGPEHKYLDEDGNEVVGWEYHRAMELIIDYCYDWNKNEMIEKYKEMGYTDEETKECHPFQFVVGDSSIEFSNPFNGMAITIQFVEDEKAAELLK